MNGIDYLLDTNFILGLLKSSPEAMHGKPAEAELLTFDRQLQGVVATKVAARSAQSK